MWLFVGFDEFIYWFVMRDNFIIIFIWIIIIEIKHIWNQI